MIAIVFLLGVLAVLTFLIGGHLARIAAAIEAQNVHYGIGAGEPEPTTSVELDG